MAKGLSEITFTKDYSNKKKGETHEFTKGFANKLVNDLKVAKFKTEAAPKKAAPKKATK